MKTNLNFYPQPANRQWDNVEICPVFDDGKGNVEMCAEGQHSYWSVYLRKSSEYVLCVADCDTKEQAEALGLLLSNAAQSFSK